MTDPVSPGVSPEPRPSLGQRSHQGVRAPREGLWRTSWGGVATVGKHCSGVFGGPGSSGGGPEVEGTDSRLGMGVPGVLTEACH